MRNNVAANGGRPPAEQGGLNKLMGLARPLMIYFAIKSFSGMMKTPHTSSSQQSDFSTSSSSLSPSSSDKDKPLGATDNILHGNMPHNSLFRPKSPIQLSIIFTNSSSNPTLLSDGDLKYDNVHIFDSWYESDLLFSDNPNLLNQNTPTNPHYRESALNLTITPEFMSFSQNQSIYAHSYLSLAGASRWVGDTVLGDGSYDNKKSFSHTVNLFRFQKTRRNKKISKARNLLGNDEDDDDNEKAAILKAAADAAALADPSSILSEFVYEKFMLPELTFSLVPGINQQFPRGGIPAQVTDSSSFKFYGHDASGAYFPVLYMNEFWLTQDKLIAINETLLDETFEVKLTYNTLSMWKWQLMVSMEKQWESQANVNGMMSSMGGKSDADPSTSRKESDMVSSEPATPYTSCF